MITDESVCLAGVPVTVLTREVPQALDTPTSSITLPSTCVAACHGVHTVSRRDVICSSVLCKHGSVEEAIRESTEG